MSEKRCPRCGEYKQASEYGMRGGSRSDELRSYCKKCEAERQKMQAPKRKEYFREYNKRWAATHHVERATYMREYAHQTGRARSMQTAKDTPLYLGVHVAERALSKFFDNITRMPFGNPGYDFLCGKGFKIDVKSACRSFKRNRWTFRIRRNKIADFFLCVAFDDRESLTPEHVWLIPSAKVNHLAGITITENTVVRWEPYERPLDRVLTCCEELR